MVETFLRPGFTFDQFACGNSNQLAFSAAAQVTEGSASLINPLVIYGAHGMGKSHLLNAIGHQVVSHNQNSQVICCSADSFMYTFTECLKTNQMHEFRKSFGSADFVLVDDIQRLAHKERTQEEFLYLFDRLVNRQAPIALACDQPPSKLKGFSGKLLSRFCGGLVVELSAPDYGTKRIIIDKLALRHQVSLSEEVADFVANIPTQNIRELEGMLIRLGAYSSLGSPVISLPMAMRYLMDVATRKS